MSGPLPSLTPPKLPTGASPIIQRPRPKLDEWMDRSGQIVADTIEQSASVRVLLGHLDGLI